MFHKSFPNPPCSNLHQSDELNGLTTIFRTSDVQRFLITSVCGGDMFSGCLADGRPCVRVCMGPSVTKPYTTSGQRGDRTKF